MNNRQKQIRKIIVEADIKGVQDFYGVPEEICDVEDSIDQLDFDSDKIALAQIAYDYELASRLMKQLIIDEKQKELYHKLKEVNSEIDKTLNIELLNERYFFLGKLFEPFTTDIDAQQRLVSLSDEKLELFKLLFNRVIKDVNNPIPILEKVLANLGTSPCKYQYEDTDRYETLNTALEEKIKQGYVPNESEVEKLLFLYTSFNSWDVKDLEDLNSLDEVIQTNEIVDKERNSQIKNIENIKQALLLKSYGICLREAKNIINKFKIKGIKITDENKDIMGVYISIKQILEEKDPGKLIKIFDDLSIEKETEFNYIQPVVIENELTEIFEKEINKVTFKTEQRNAEMIDGIEVYDAGNDFKIVMKTLAAYDEKVKFNNYKDYWNKPLILEHGNSCSLIANNNLATARIKNVCVGFSSFEPGMLLRAGNIDLGSVMHGRDLDMSMRESTYMSPEELINSTRGEYNELMYERRDLSKDKTKFKKNPDYLVFIEEYEGENIENLTYEEIEKKENEETRKILKEQKRIWEETKRAARDFSKENKPLPIVRINREECAKNEIKKINEAFNKYIQTKDVSLLPNIITQFENNRIGNGIDHDYIRNTYFPEEKIQEMLEQITKTISNIKDDKLRLKNINAVGKIILAEKKSCEDGVKNEKEKRKKNLGFDIEEYIQIYKNMKAKENVRQNR